MKQPKTYAFIGMVKKLVITHEGFQYTHTFYKNNEAYLLLGTPKKNVLACVRANSTKMFTPGKKDFQPHGEDIAKAMKLFRIFMGSRPTKITGLDMPSFNLKSFGVADLIVYESDKWNEEDSYIHTFTTRVNAWVPKSNNGMNPKYILLSGKNLRLTKGGIEG